EAIAVVEIRDVEAVDVERVLGDRRAAEGDAVEIAVALVEARRQEGDGRHVALHGQTDQVFPGDVRRGLDRAHIYAAHDAGAYTLDGLQPLCAELEIRRRGRAEADHDVGELRGTAVA